MNDPQVQVIERSRFSYFFLILAAMNAALGLSQLATSGALLLGAGNMLVGVGWAVLAFSSARPMARVTQTDIAVQPGPLRAERVVPWAAITSASLSRTNILTMTLADGKPLILAVDQAKKDQRQTLLDLVEQRVAVTRLP